MTLETFNTIFQAYSLGAHVGALKIVAVQLEHTHGETELSKSAYKLHDDLQAIALEDDSPECVAAWWRGYWDGWRDFNKPMTLAVAQGTAAGIVLSMQRHLSQAVAA